MDKIFIRGLSIETIIGIEEWEKHTPQVIKIDLEMRHNISRAASTDQIEDALDYKAVSDKIVEYVQRSRFQLIESLAENIATLIQLEFRVDWLQLSVGKPQAVGAADMVGVVIERGNRPRT